MVVTEVVSELKELKAIIKGVLAGRTVAMVTYWATKLTATYSPMIWQLFDTMILDWTDIGWL